jgi:hypothetical protein
VFKGLIGAASDRLSRSDFVGVADAIKTATPLATDDARKKTLEDTNAKIKETTAKAMTDADASYKDSKYLPAVKTYVALSQAFAADELGKKAKTALDAAEKDKDAAAVIPEARAEVILDQVTTLIAQCRKAGKTGEDAEVVAKMPADDKTKALQLLGDIVKNYGPTDTGKKAQAMLDKVNAGK